LMSSELVITPIVPPNPVDVKLACHHVVKPPQVRVRKPDFFHQQWIGLHRVSAVLGPPGCVTWTTP
jgi:hypothetical protein